VIPDQHPGVLATKPQSHCSGEICLFAYLFLFCGVRGGLGEARGYTYLF